MTRDVMKKFLSDGETMTRDDLIEIMARATVRWRWGQALATVQGNRRLETHDQEMMATALDAAEREGWRFVPPPEEVP